MKRKVELKQNSKIIFGFPFLASDFKFSSVLLNIDPHSTFRDTI